MLIELVKAAVGVLLILAVWVTVDGAWRRIFPQAGDGAGCRGCAGCTRQCSESEDTRDTHPPGG